MGITTNELMKSRRGTSKEHLYDFGLIRNFKELFWPVDWENVYCEDDLRHRGLVRQVVAPSINVGDRVNDYCNSMYINLRHRSNEWRRTRDRMNLKKRYGNAMKFSKLRFSDKLYLYEK